MKQEGWFGVITLVVLAGLTLFYNPVSANLEGKIIFFGIIVIVIMFFLISDVYKKIEKNEIKINLFDQKWDIHERIKKIEELNKTRENGEKK